VGSPGFVSFLPLTCVASAEPSADPAPVLQAYELSLAALKHALAQPRPPVKPDTPAEAAERRELLRARQEANDALRALAGELGALDRAADMIGAMGLTE
jgi:hypothetical protein